MAFDPIFRWLHDAVIPSDLSRPPCLQPTPRAYANDFAVAAPSFWTLMPAIAPAFRTQDTVAGTSLKKQKRYWWVHEASDNLDSWVVDNSPDLGVMKITRVAKDVGAMIGSDGYLHRLTVPRNKFVRVCGIISESSKSLIERLVEF